MSDLFPSKQPGPETRPQNVKKKPTPTGISMKQIDAMVRALHDDPEAWRHVTEVLQFTEEAITDQLLGLRVDAAERKWLAYPYFGFDGKALSFPYIKLRSMTGAKEFRRMPAGAPSQIYNAHHLRWTPAVAVVFEGERDAVAALSMEIRQDLSDAYHLNGGKTDKGPDAALVSVPDGTASATRPVVIAALQDQKIIYIALDADEPGEKAAAELAQALGPERCRRVRFPGYKDLGDLLAAKGVDEGRKLALEAFAAATLFTTTTGTPAEVADPASAPTPESPIREPAAVLKLLPGGKRTSVPTLAEARQALAALTAISTLEEVEAVLGIYAAVPQLEGVARAVERERLVAALRCVKAISSPARLADGCFGVAPAERASLVHGEVEPAGEPQRTGDLLGELAAVFEKYAVLPPGAAIVLASWVLHTWVLDAASFTARIAVRSPTRRCGKSLLLEILGTVCAHPIMTANISSAALFRAVEAWRPTLLVDEADSFLHENEELRGVLNAGFKYDGVVLRCDGDENEPRAFKCFAPVVIAAIGPLPATLADRSLTIGMSRKGKGEKVQRFDRRAREDLASLRPRLARWAQDSEEALRGGTPSVPEVLNDRQRDVAEPLIAIADLAGGQWPATVREAVVTLCGAVGDEGDKRERLLGAVWGLFGEDVEFITTKEIVSRLLEEDESEWHEASKGKPLSPVWLARWLGAFGLKTKRPRLSAERGRGYLRDDLRPAVAKYLPPIPDKGGDLPGPPGPNGVNDTKTQQNPALDLTRTTSPSGPGKNPEKPKDLAGGPGGPGRNPPSPGSEGGDGAMVPVQPEEIWTADELTEARRRIAAEVPTT